MRGAKSANSDLFKDFCNEAEMEKNGSNCGSYFDMLTKSSLQKTDAKTTWPKIYLQIT